MKWSIPSSEWRAGLLQKSSNRDFQMVTKGHPSESQYSMHPAQETRPVKVISRRGQQGSDHSPATIPTTVQSLHQAEEIGHSFSFPLPLWGLYAERHSTHPCHNQVTHAWVLWEIRNRIQRRRQGNAYEKHEEALRWKFWTAVGK